MKMNYDAAQNSGVPGRGAAKSEFASSIIGVRPCGWTESSQQFDRLARVLILKLSWAESLFECNRAPPSAS